MDRGESTAAVETRADERYPGRTDLLGIKCGACGSTRTYGYPGNAFCARCGAHDQDGG